MPDTHAIVTAMKRLRTGTRILYLLLAALLLVLIMLRWFEHSQVYHPTRTLDAAGEELNRPVQNVFFQASKGPTLNGWFFPADANSPRRRIAVLVCHGNGGNISHRLGLANALLTTGANVLLFDYQGYGRSEGRPSEEGTYQDALAAYEWLRREGFSPTNIVAYGESLGGAVAAELACRAPIGGLVLQSTFTSIPDVGSDIFPWLPVRWMARIRYDTVNKLPRVKVPVLVMHSRADELIRFQHAEKNFAAANQPKLFREVEGSHNDPLVNREKFIAGVDALLDLIPGGKTIPARAE